MSSWGPVQAMLASRSSVVTALLLPALRTAKLVAITCPSTPTMRIWHSGKAAPARKNPSQS